MKNNGVAVETSPNHFRKCEQSFEMWKNVADFTSHHPARMCYAVKTLPLNASVEIDAIAVANMKDE